eukprot:11155279-Lingulodinium_polyedra.AAC.1
MAGLLAAGGEGIACRQRAGRAQRERPERACRSSNARTHRVVHRGENVLSADDTTRRLSSFNG